MTDRRRPDLATNVLWTWASVAISLSMAMFVMPMMIRRLGDEAYGLWALVFSVVEYFALLDMGMRSALVKYIAHHRVLHEDHALHHTINTGFAYLASISGGLLLVTAVLAPFGPRFFGLKPELSGTFLYMELVTGAGWAIGIMFLCFAAGLEAAQRFDLSNQIQIVASFVRVAGMFVMLELGFGLTAVVTAAVGARLFQCLLLWRAFTRVFPEFRLSLAAVDWRTFRRLWNFGMHTVPSTMGALLSTQGPPILIGRAMPVQFVGYFALPNRLVQPILDLVYRVGSITTARSAELAACRRTDSLLRLAIMANRYSMIAFIPFAALLLTYGDALFAVWFTPEFVRLSAPLLSIFVLGGIADASQANSGCMLYGLARHQIFTRLALAESLLSLSAIGYFTSVGDLWSAAAASTAVLIVNRGLLTPALLCRQLGCSVAWFITEIAARPLAVAAVTGAVLRLCRATWLPGTSLPQILAAGAISITASFALAGRYCVLSDHRRRILDVLRRRAPMFVAPAGRWLGETVAAPAPAEV